MTSVNELNGAERARKEGYNKGYDDGYNTGYYAARSVAKLEYQKTTLMQYIIALILGVAIAYVAGDIKQACAAEAQTSVQVVITAEVACNPENCPEPGTEEPLQVESAQEDSTLWSRMVKWWQALF
jgi:DMSO reductase anchor subunit